MNNQEFDQFMGRVRHKSEKPFIIVSDDDGHKYLIPEEKYDDFYDWCDAVSGSRESIHDFNEFRIEGFSRIRIFEWEET